MNNQRFHWITFNYRRIVERKYGIRIPEEPKIEICKDCRTIRAPAENEVVTTLDPRLLRLALPHVKQLDLNEQLSNKLYVIGVTTRQRRHFDIFDCDRIVKFNADRLDWSVVRDSFHAILRRESARSHIERARRLIENTVRDSNTTRRIESGTFEPFDFRGGKDCFRALLLPVLARNQCKASKSPGILLDRHLRSSVDQPTLDSS